MNRLLVLFIAVFAIACNTHVSENTNNNAQLLDTASASCPYVTKDEKGDLVASWIRQTDSNQFVVCYAISADAGKTFGAPIIIPGSNNVHPHGENMPKILFKPNGEIIAAWGAANPNPKNKYAGLVFYSQSFDKGAHWTAVRPLSDDTASIDQRYFDMALLPNGEAAIVWLDNRKPWQKEGSALYYATTSGNTGFRNEKPISGPCCQCCRTDLFVDSKKNIHVLYRAIIGDTIRDMVHMVSTDNAQHFSAPKRISEDNWVISGCPHTGPAITETESGLHFAWFTGGDSAGIYYNQSADNGKSFTPRQAVAGARSLHCQLATMPGDNVLVVWNETFVNNGKLSSRIGLQQRNGKGEAKEPQLISPEAGDASFPVVQAVGTNLALVAYTYKQGGKDFVYYVLRPVENGL